MATSTHSARIIGPVAYVHDGKAGHIPVGPCLVERRDSGAVDIIWGARGQRSASLPASEVKAAEDIGHLVLLD